MVKFFQKYRWLYIIFYMSHIAMWSYITLAPMVLAKYYNFSSVLLTFSSNVFLLSLLISGIVSNILFSNKINFTKWVLFSYTGMLLTIIILLLGLYYDIHPSFYYLVKLFEGIFFGISANLFNYMFKIILLKNQRNNLINSLNTSITYLTKAIMPIIISAFLIFPGQEYSILYVGILVYVMLIILTMIKRKQLYIRTRSHLNHYHGKTYATKSFLANLKNILNFYNVIYLKEKIFFTLIIITQNAARPFYDLYMVLYLINYQHFSIIYVSSLMSAMVFGQASQFLSSYLLLKMDIRWFRLLGLVLYTSMFFSIITIDIVLNNVYLSYIIFYLLGLGRSFFANYEYAYMMQLSQKVKINEVDFIRMILSEATHNMSYLILGFILLFGFEVSELFNIWYYLAIMLFFIWYFFDYKNSSFFQESKKARS